jgi:Uma2 family endonuclease
MMGPPEGGLTMNAPITRPTPYLCPSLAGTLMAPDEFDAIDRYDERFRYELVHGVLVVVPIAGCGETDPNEQLGYWLRAYQEHHPQGAALDLTMPQQYVATRTGRRLADRLIWIGLGRLPELPQDVPTIAVEFVSRRRRERVRDYEDKRREYLEVGVREYWIIDRFQQRMTVVRPQDGQSLGVEQVVTEAETYTTPLLPGFELPLARLLTVADRWPGRRR